MVFQDPRAHVNPVRRIGDFLTEALRLRGVAREEATRRAVAALDDVGIPDGQRAAAASTRTSCRAACCSG